MPLAGMIRLSELVTIYGDRLRAQSEGERGQAEVAGSKREATALRRCVLGFRETLCLVEVPLRERCPRPHLRWELANFGIEKWPNFGGLVKDRALLRLRAQMAKDRCERAIGKSQAVFVGRDCTQIAYK